jgi:hypothetical protein
MVIACRKRADPFCNSPDRASNPAIRGGMMSAEAVGAGMPTQVTLDDLAQMAAADENHRYELSPEAVLSVVPLADPDHALLVSRIFAWFLTNGYGPEQVVTDCGIPR